MAAYTEQEKDLIFALDIGTRSIVGVVGRLVKDRFQVLAVESAEYSKRTMLDGQIDDIAGVAALARTVTDRLGHKLEVDLKRVCVAAAGRALRTQRGVFSVDLPDDRTISANDIGEMEAGAVSAAEEALRAQVADLAEMARQPLVAERMVEFLKRSNQLLTRIIGK